MVNLFAGPTVIGEPRVAVYILASEPRACDSQLCTLAETDKSGLTYLVLLNSPRPVSSSGKALKQSDIGCLSSGKSFVIHDCI